MTNAERRRFLQMSAMTVGTSVLAGCGGSGNADPTAANLADEPLRPTSGKTSSTQEFSSLRTQAPRPPAGAMQFTLSSSNAQQVAPFCLGYAFRQGDVPAGQTVVSNKGALQVTPKNTWPDGSLKFAVLSGRVYLTTNSAVTVSLEKAVSVRSRGALTTVDLKRTNIRAQVSAGNLGSVSWIGTDWDGFTQAWISGPEMSSWIYRKPLGTDAHLVVWLEVRLFASGAVEVLPWVENGYLNVAGPTVKTGTFDFSLGGISRFNAPITLPHHTRTPLIQGTALSYWLAGDPAVIAQPDLQYLQATELVPSYFAKTTNLTDGYAIKATSYTPLQQGDYKFGPDQIDSMTNSGYGEPIGLLPGWDAKLLTAEPAVYGALLAAVVRNGYSAGRYPIHYRDEKTNLVPAFSAYPTTCLADCRNDGSGFYSQGGSSTGTYTPAITDKSGTKTWDTAHSPAVGFLPYLLTGRLYFLEEVQFAAVTNFLGNDTVIRDNGKGLHRPAYGAWQVRASAWGFRALAHALCITPDTDTALRSEFQASMQANIDFYYGRYVAQPNNPLGFIYDWSTGAGGYGEAAPWQCDFFTGVVGHTMSMGLPLPSSYQTKLGGFMGYIAKSIIGRLGTGQSPDWWYINAFPYQVAVSPAPQPDWAGGTGPWYTTWREAYTATYTPPPPWLGSTEGTLAFEYPNPGDVVRGFLANALPAITYAVRHGVPGALAAYNRLIGANNYPSFLSAFNSFPVWATKPAESASASTPTWLQGKALNEWFPISGTSGAGGAPLNDYSGFGLTTDGKIAAGAAGGHGGSRDNRVVVLNLLSDAPTWSVLNTASSTAPDDVAYNPDGKPASRHTYHSTIYVPYFDRVMLFGVRFTAPSAYTFEKVDGFNVSTGAWDGVVPGRPGQSGSGYADNLPGYYGAAIDGTGNVWSTGGLAKYSPSSNTWSQPVTSPAPNGVRYPWAWDSRRQQMFGLCWGDGEGYNADVRAIKQVGSSQTQVTFNSSAALSQFMADRPTYAGMDYDGDNNRFLFFSNDHPTRIYVITPNDGNVWDMTLLTLGSGSVALPSTSAPLVSKFRYVPQLKGFVCMPDAAQNLYFIRTA